VAIPYSVDLTVILTITYYGQVDAALAGASTTGWFKKRIPSLFWG